MLALKKGDCRRKYFYDELVAAFEEITRPGVQYLTRAERQISARTTGIIEAMAPVLVELPGSGRNTRAVGGDGRRVPQKAHTPHKT
jgi:uncharacterized SAM-dependent methyltransferase